MFGPHLTLDLYSCDRKKLFDADFMRKLLHDLPEVIGMTKISDPFILSYPGKEGSFDQGGISGFVLIAESHISIHTFVAQEFASIDIFSCKEFDVELAEQHIMKALGAKKVERNFLLRGREFPKDIVKSAAIVAASRKKTKVRQAK